jgi:hypothetical protein
MDPGFGQLGDQPRRLRVVKYSDITSADPGQQRPGISIRHLAIVAELSLTKSTAVSGRAVDAIVQTFGDGKEILVALNDQPPDVQANAEGVADEDLEHLRHASAHGRRVDVPDRGAAQPDPKIFRRPLQRVEPTVADYR